MVTTLLLELLAGTPSINMLMSSQENNRHLWGSFPHQQPAERGCCLARTSAAPVRAFPTLLAVPVTLTRVPALPGGHPVKTCTTAKPPNQADTKSPSCCCHPWLCHADTLPVWAQLQPSAQPACPGNKLPSQGVWQPGTQTLAGGGLFRHPVMWTTACWEAWTAGASRPRVNWGNAAVRKCQCSHPGWHHSDNRLMRLRGDTGAGRAVLPGTAAQSLLPGTYGALLPQPRSLYRDNLGQQSSTSGSASSV